MYFTSEDNPHGSRPNLQTDATSKFKDLGTVELNIVSFKEDFQFDKFYSVFDTYFSLLSDETVTDNVCIV